MTIKVEAINIDTLHTAEAVAIRAAEAEAEAVYEDIANEENEQARILELRAVCAIIVRHKLDATPYVTAYLNNTTLFNDEEKATLILASDNYNNDDLATALRTFDLLRSANALYRIVKAGGYPELTATNLLSKIKPAPTKNKFMF